MVMHSPQFHRKCEPYASLTDLSVSFPAVHASAAGKLGLYVCSQVPYGHLGMAMDPCTTVLHALRRAKNMHSRHILTDAFGLVAPPGRPGDRHASRHQYVA